MTLYFDLDSPHNKTLRDWRGPSGAKRHAREHGVAGAWRANASFVLFYMDAGIEKGKPRGYIIRAIWRKPFRDEQWIAMDIPELLATIESLTEPAKAAQD